MFHRSMSILRFSILAVDQLPAKESKKIRSPVSIPHISRRRTLDRSRHVGVASSNAPRSWGRLIIWLTLPGSGISIRSQAVGIIKQVNAQHMVIPCMSQSPKSFQ